MRPDPMPAPRHHHIDLLKALAILLVVLGHSIQFTQSLYQDCIAFQAIYSFHMHLFFFVSGILASGSALGARLRSRAATLLVPFVAWMPIYWFAERVLRIGPDLGGLTAYILATFAAPSLGLWFLWALFLIHLVHAALQATHRLILATALAIAIFAFLQMQLPNPEIFGLGYVKMYLAYFVLGTVVKAHEPSIRRIPLPYVLALVPAYLAAILLARAGFLPATRHLAAVAAVLGLYRIALACPIQNRIVRWLSENTLAIYALHVLVLEILLSCTSLRSVLHSHALFAFAATLAVTVPSILLLKRIPLIQPVFFGRHPDGGKLSPRTWGNRPSR